MKTIDLIPPILTNLARRLKQRGDIFDSYESALRACGDGYKEDKLVNVVYEKTKRYRDMLISQRPVICDVGLLRTFIGLSANEIDSELNVLDFGGACGAHYFLAKILCDNKLRLRWHVVETPTMSESARDLEDGRLRFFDNLYDAKNELDRVDHVFSSGALQYVPQPYEYLKDLTQCGSTTIYLTRIGLTTAARDFFSIQRSRLSANGPGPLPDDMHDETVRYPVSFVRKDRFEEILSEQYSILIQFNEGKQAYLAGDTWIDMYGYLARKSS